MSVFLCVLLYINVEKRVAGRQKARRRSSKRRKARRRTSKRRKARRRGVEKSVSGGRKESLRGWEIEVEKSVSGGKKLRSGRNR